MKPDQGVSSLFSNNKITHQREEVPSSHLNSRDDPDHSASPRLKTAFAHNTGLKSGESPPTPVPKIANMKRIDEGPWESTKGVPIHFNRHDQSGMTLTEQSHFQIQASKTGV